MGCTDIVHDVLDLAGFIPAAANSANAANAAVYAAEGDWENAAESAAAAIPMVGNTTVAATQTLRLAANGTKTAGWALSKAKQMKSFFSMMTGKAKTGARKAINKISRKIKAGKEKNEGKEVCTDGKCFTGDMLVCTKHGLRPIKDIRKGDDVYSRDENTGETGLRKVEKVFWTEAYTIYHIWLDEKEEIKTTAYHPFYVKDRGWVTSIQLQENDLLETRKGTVRITGIVKVRHEEPVIVYNFHVDEWSSYFVSELGVYVHNKKNKHHGNETENDKEIPWSSKKVSDASKQLDAGEKNVYVDTREQAEELFLGKYQGEGYTNTTGMKPGEVKDLYGSKGGTYHWDEAFDEKTGRLIDHAPGNPDGAMRHLQVHPPTGGTVRIFYNK